MTFAVRSLVIWLVRLSMVIAGCSTPTPTVEPTTTSIPPTDVPTDTPVPPTATSTSTATLIPTATSTSVPTAPPTPPATSTSIKVAATAKPSVTPKATVANQTQSALNTAAIPPGSPLNVAVKMTFNNVQVLLGELNNVLAGITGSCDTSLARYDAIAAAPAYDVSQQSTDTQTAYALYRQGVDTINESAYKVRRVCLQGGGIIDKLDILVGQKSAGDALGPLGHAIDLLPPVATTLVQSPPKPAATPVPQKMALSDLLLQTIERMHGVGGLLDGAQLNLDANFCQQFGPQYQTIITKVILDKTDKPAAWVAQYGAYEASIAYFQNKLYRAKEVCDAGGDKIGKDEFSDMRRNVDVAAIVAARAYDELKKADALGQ